MSDPTHRELELEAELIALARYARHLESTVVANRMKRRESPETVLAGLIKRRTDFGVTEAMQRAQALGKAREG